MRTYIYGILIGVLFISLRSCGKEINENTVRKAAAHSNETNHKYIAEQREYYVKSLEDCIKTLDNDLEKLRDVSVEGKKESDIATPLQQLAAEKALLEGSLRALHEKTEFIEKQMDVHYSRYNFALDSLLKDADNFFASYKLNENTPGN